MDIANSSQPFTAFINNSESYYAAFISKIEKSLPDIEAALFIENPIQTTRDNFIKVLKDKTEEIYHSDIVNLYNWMDVYKYGALSKLCLHKILEALIEKSKKSDILSNFDEILRKEINETFDKLDSNNNHKLGKLDIHKALKACNPYITSDEIINITEKADRNKNGLIEKEEFCNCALPLLKEILLNCNDRLRDLEIVLRQVDNNNSGFVTADQLFYTLTKFGVQTDKGDVSTFLREVSNKDAADITILVHAISTVFCLLGI